MRVCFRPFLQIKTRNTKKLIFQGGQSNKDACSGDSGGPLAVNYEGQEVIVGIVVASTTNSTNPVQCGGDDFYGTYTNVASYRRWVESITGILPTLQKVADHQGYSSLGSPPSPTLPPPILLKDWSSCAPQFDLHSLFFIFTCIFMYYN